MTGRSLVADSQGVGKRGPCVGVEGGRRGSEEAGEEDEFRTAEWCDKRERSSVGKKEAGKKGRSIVGGSLRGDSKVYEWCVRNEGFAENYTRGKKGKKGKKDEEDRQWIMGGSLRGFPKIKEWCDRHDAAYGKQYVEEERRRAAGRQSLMDSPNFPRWNTGKKERDMTDDAAGKKADASLRGFPRMQECEEETEEREKTEEEVGGTMGADVESRVSRDMEGGKGAQHSQGKVHGSLVGSRGAVDKNGSVEKGNTPHGKGEGNVKGHDSSDQVKICPEEEVKVCGLPSDVRGGAVKGGVTGGVKKAVMGGSLRGLPKKCATLGKARFLPERASYGRSLSKSFTLEAHELEGPDPTPGAAHPTPGAVHPTPGAVSLSRGKDGRFLVRSKSDGSLSSPRALTAIFTPPRRDDTPSASCPPWQVSDA